ncbi:MAG: acyl-CoA synthetase (AMP-forming)/AMP-acid ligase II [Hydrogenophaga sp.]|jgi:acyl-CoA synthetase (AMP-forming)/AMP-acid ligase II
MQITQALHRAVARQPGAVATICGGRRHTFAQFQDRVSRVAGALQKLGVQPGDRVGILSLNSDRYVEFFMAVPWAGAAVNPVNTRWSAAEIAYSLDDCDTQVLLIDDPFLPLLPELLQRTSSLRTLIHVGDGPIPDGLLSYEALLTEADPVPDARRGGKDLAGVFYTGGTTGFPKGVMLSHDGLCQNSLFAVAEGMARAGAIGLHAAPLFHIAAITVLGFLWAVGGTHVTLPSFTPLGVLQAIEREQISTTVLVPTMIQMTVDHPEAAGFDLSSLETLVYGASPISEALVERATKLLATTQLIQIYGMTEMAPIMTTLTGVFHRGEGLARGKVRSAGQATFGVEVRIVDAQGAELPRGEVGEIAVLSPAVMLGYWNKPEETAKALGRPDYEGWMHTGDAGRMDEEGFLFLVDRVKDMIVSGGENVYSVEVEQAIAKHPAVAACAVIGVPDADWGERVHVVVVLKANASATADDIRDHCKTLIGGYKCPRSVDFVQALPVSGAGKVLKTKLREPFWAGQARQVA